jgi:hypothetical protein
MLAQKGSVVLRNKHRAAAYLQSRQDRVLVEPAGQPYKRGHAKTGLEYLESAAVAFGVKGVNGGCPAFLAVRYSVRSRVLGDAIRYIVYRKGIVAVGVERHPGLFLSADRVLPAAPQETIIT